MKEKLFSSPPLHVYGDEVRLKMRFSLMTSLLEPGMSDRYSRQTLPMSRPRMGSEGDEGSMVRTEVSLKLMSLLLQGDPVSYRQLAAEIGFKNPRNIATHLRSFVNMGYITCLPGDEYGPGNWYQLTSKKEGVLALYQSAFYKRLRNRIREIPWFVAEMTEGFRDLPPDIFLLIQEMMTKSHTFFTMVAASPSHERMLATYSLYLFPCRLMHAEDPYFQACFLYAQLYSEAVTRDIAQGGLAERFLEPLDRIQKVLTDVAPSSRMSALPFLGTGSHCDRE